MNKREKNEETFFKKQTMKHDEKERKTQWKMMNKRKKTMKNDQK